MMIMMMMEVKFSSFEMQVKFSNLRMQGDI